MSLKNLYICLWNKTFKFEDNLLKSLIFLFDFWSDSMNSIIFSLFYANIQAVLNITSDNMSTLFWQHAHNMLQSPKLLHLPDRKPSFIETRT